MNLRGRVTQTYFNFFSQRNHHILPPSPLVSPTDDLLFTIAGMVQFEQELSGQQQPTHNRVVTCQPCIRTKDIDRVGQTPRHLTGFEMLGNFSFGSYGRSESIQWGWELVTEQFNLPLERLIVTVHPDDRDSYRYWRRYLPHSRIIKLEENVWRSGNGTGGLCSEMFYDFFPEQGLQNIDLDSDRFVEFYNIVFIGDSFVDSGLGVERLCWILSDLPTVYDTDCFDCFDSPVVRDHKRTSDWLLQEINPSNKQQGYILRRLMRRCFIQGYVPVEGDRPQWHDEYRRYQRSVQQGRQQLEKIENPSQDDLERLWQTYGIPVEVSRQILSN